MNNIGRNAKITERTINFSLNKDHSQETRTEDRAIVKEAILDCIDSSIGEILNSVLLRTAVEVDQGLLVTVESMAKIGLETLDFNGAWHGSDLDLHWRLLNFTWKGSTRA